MNGRDKLAAMRAQPVEGGRPTDKATPAIVAPKLSTVRPADVRWLWGGRIPYGKLTVVAGDPGVGKSYLTLAVAAAVTRGAPLPGDDGQREPGRVLLASYEDEPADTLRPRADLLGVDLDRCHVVEGVLDRPGDKPHPFGPADVEALAGSVARHPDLRLLVLDPVAAWIGAGVDTYRDNEVRAALDGLRLLAAEHGLAVLLVMHMRKSGAANALARLSGSGAYGQLVRSALLAGRDPDDDSRCALAHTKHNLAPRQPTIGYRIDDHGLTWTGEVADLDGERLAGHDPDDRQTQRGEAEAFLRDVLADGPRKASDIQATAEAHDLAASTVKNAKKRLGVLTERHGFGPGSYVTWSLPVIDGPHRDHRDHTYTPDPMVPMDESGPYAVTERNADLAWVGHWNEAAQARQRDGDATATTQVSDPDQVADEHAGSASGAVDGSGFDDALRLLEAELGAEVIDDQDGAA